MMSHHPIAWVTLPWPKLPDTRKDTACLAGVAGPRRLWGKGLPRPVGSALCYDQLRGPCSVPKVRKKQSRQVSQSLLHTGALYPPPLVLLNPTSIGCCGQSSHPPHRRWCGGSNPRMATWLPLPTHLQEEATQSPECAVRES